METDELPALDQNVDFRQVPPLHQKRTIAFVNNFIMQTVSFLNNFAASCESRLMDLECKIERVEASLLILESQLSSIPWLKSSTKEPQKTITENGDIQILNLPEVTVETEIIVQDNTDTSSNNNNPDNSPKASEDPRFIRFFKMIQVGVPLPAVKLKMESEGVDSSVLDNPNATIPGHELAKNNTDSLTSEDPA